MAATIVAFVSEDHQDYELMETSTTENAKKTKKGKPFSLTPKKTYLNISRAFSSSLSHLYSRPVQVANMQDVFSLKMFYDVSWCFTSMS